MTELFNSIERKRIANGNGLVAVYPTLTQFITIEIHDPETERMVGCMDFDVEGARELRDWLNAALPADGGSEHG